MKYLKRFNEELNPDTYLKAAKGLKAYHPERANRLERHVLNDDYQKFGTFNLIESQDKGYNKALSYDTGLESAIRVGKYSIIEIAFELDMTRENSPIEFFYFYVFFKELNVDKFKTLNIVVPYQEGEFKKAKIDFWEEEDIVLFADRASALKFKKVLHHFVYQSKSFYNEVEHFPFKETLYRQLDDLSEDPEMEFNFDDNSFNDLIKYLTLDHISINKLFSTSTERFKLPITIE